MSRCDLHIHSKFSARSEDWLFRRFDFPDSCTEPLDVYTQLHEHGMDFVTITDHDCIDGCLAIADKPRTFISEQVTTYFPQDPCKLHVLVWGISSAQHQDISVFRSNIFELQRYLAENRIAHAIAHPLYSVNGKLTASHLERLILLFKHFEGINGLRDSLLSDLATKLLRELTPAKIDEFANRHDLAPTHPEPWKKILVGGSDDHGGKFFASAFTETPKAKTRRNFSLISPQAAVTRRVAPELPSPFRTDSTTRSPVLFRDVSTKSWDPAQRCLSKCFRASWKGEIRRNSHCVRKPPSLRRVCFPERFSSWPSRPMFRFGTSSRAISPGLK
jgi:hypothetical protein